MNLAFGSYGSEVRRALNGQTIHGSVPFGFD